MALLHYKYFMHKSAVYAWLASGNDELGGGLEGPVMRWRLPRGEVPLVECIR
jgi:hypothetical protein